MIRKTELTREEWLHRAKNELDKLIKRQCGVSTPECLLSISSPLRGDRNGKVLGSCYYTDGRPHIMISPRLGRQDEESTARVLDVFLHELIHTITQGHGHRGLFREYARKCHLQGPMTATTASPALKRHLLDIISIIGIIPGEPLRPKQKTPAGGKKPQKNRQHKVYCPEEDCGYIARVSRMWLDISPPICPQCHIVMVREDK